MLSLGRIRLERGSGQYHAEKQPVAVGAAQQVGVFALPAEAGALGQRLFHQRGGVDEDLDVLACAGGDLAGQGLEAPLDDLVIVIAPGVDRDIAGRPVRHFGKGVVLRAIVEAKHHGGPGPVPHGGRMGAALQRRLHPAHLAVPSRLDEMRQPLARTPWLGRGGKAADVEAQGCSALTEGVAGVGQHGPLSHTARFSEIRNPDRRTRPRRRRPESDRRAGAGSRVATSASCTRSSGPDTTPRRSRRNSPAPRGGRRRRCRPG